MNLLYIGNELGCVGWDELQNNTREVNEAELVLISFGVKLKC